MLNSLADEKFYASIRCVAKHGRFLELGKYDLLLDHSIGKLLKFKMDYLKNNYVVVSISVTFLQICILKVTS